MRPFVIGCLSVALLLQVPALVAQQQHSTQTSPTPSDPTKNNPDVPHQAPSADNNPDLAPQNQPAPGGTSTAPQDAKTAKSKHRKKSTKTTTSTGATSTSTTQD